MLRNYGAAQWRRIFGGGNPSQNLGGNTKARVAVVSRQTGYLDLFIVDWGGQVLTRQYQGGAWSPGWNLSLGGYMLDISASSSVYARIELIARGRDAQVYYRYWTPAGWSQGPYGFQ
jgi:hypothetical protein